MKKQRKPRRTAAKKSGAAPAQAPKQANGLSRRQLITYAQYGLLGTIVVGGAGAYGVTSVMASVREQDLSQIGQGIPTVVQVHDPQCPDCTTLQRAARRALSDFDDGSIDYRIASLVSEDGLAFSREYGVGRVTLVLFDSSGRMVDVMTGTREADHLANRFQRLIDTDR